MTNTIKFPVSGPTSIADDTLPNGARFYTVFTRPDTEHPLCDIPKGPNPRDVDDTGKIPKAIFNSYLNDPLFAIKCRGMRAVIDADSLRIYEDEDSPTGWYVSMAFDSYLAGHYDGQHSADRTDSAINHDEDDSNKTYTLHLVENTAFLSKDEIRGVASAANAVQPQKSKSEINILGGFDVAKGNLSYCDETHIGWKENQKLPTGEKVPNELGVGQVTCLLGTVLPSLYVTGAGLGDISSWPKKGREALNKFWIHEDKGVLLNSASEHIDIILEFADFVQSEMRTILGAGVNTYAIITKDTKKGPAPFCNYTFKDAESTEYALTKELLNTVCYSVLNHAFRPEDGKLVAEYTIAELKAIWLACGKQVLDQIEARYQSNFASVFNNRWGDFVADETLWALCSNEAQRTVVNRPTWSTRLALVAK